MAVLGLQPLKDVSQIILDLEKRQKQINFSDVIKGIDAHADIMRQKAEAIIALEKILVPTQVQERVDIWIATARAALAASDFLKIHGILHELGVGRIDEPNDLQKLIATLESQN